MKYLPFGSWNSLESHSPTVFKSRLKTVLFDHYQRLWFSVYYNFIIIRHTCIKNNFKTHYFLGVLPKLIARQKSAGPG